MSRTFDREANLDALRQAEQRVRAQAQPEPAERDARREDATGAPEQSQGEPQMRQTPLAPSDQDRWLKLGLWLAGLVLAVASFQWIFTLPQGAEAPPRLRWSVEPSGTPAADAQQRHLNVDTWYANWFARQRAGELPVIAPLGPPAEQAAAPESEPPPAREPLPEPAGPDAPVAVAAAPALGMVPQRMPAPGTADSHSAVGPRPASTSIGTSRQEARPDLPPEPVGPDLPPVEVWTSGISPPAGLQTMESAPASLRQELPDAQEKARGLQDHVTRQLPLPPTGGLQAVRGVRVMPHPEDTANGEAASDASVGRGTLRVPLRGLTQQQAPDAAPDHPGVAEAIPQEAVLPAPAASAPGDATIIDEAPRAPEATPPESSQFEDAPQLEPPASSTPATKAPVLRRRAMGFFVSIKPKSAAVVPQPAPAAPEVQPAPARRAEQPADSDATKQAVPAPSYRHGFWPFSRAKPRPAPAEPSAQPAQAPPAPEESPSEPAGELPVSVRRRPRVREDDLPTLKEQPASLFRPAQF